MEKTIKQVIFPPKLSLNITKVAAYARVSTGKDAMLHSLSAQVSYYSNLINNHPGWIYCGVYADEALTGTKENRENFQRMMTACRNGEINMIITKSLSRLARNTVTLLETVRELKGLGVDVYFEEQNIHTLSAEGELMLTILASYAQEESRSASENQKWRVRKGFENGELLNWRFLYGYDIDKNAIRVNAEQAEVVRDIFRRFLDGESMSGIATSLNKAGIPGTFGAQWRPQQIRCILSNEKYTGNALLWKHFTNNHIEKRKMVNRGELPMFYAEETHAAIVDQATFARTQEKLAAVADAFSYRAKATRSAFSGMIVCDQCGQKYKRTKNHGRYIWNCSTYLVHGKGACPGLQIREDILQQAAALALGLSEYDETVFESRIQQVRAKASHELTFIFQDGGKLDVPWKKAPRGESWTPEMKAAAAERTRRQRRKQ